MSELDEIGERVEFVALMSLDEARERFPPHTIVQWCEGGEVITRMVIDVPELTDDGLAVLVPVGHQDDGPEYAHADGLRVVDVVALQDELEHERVRANMVDGLHQQLLLAAAAALGIDLGDPRHPPDVVLRQIKATQFPRQPCRHEPLFKLYQHGDWAMDVAVVFAREHGVEAWLRTLDPWNRPWSPPIGGPHAPFLPPSGPLTFPQSGELVQLVCRHCKALYVDKMPENSEMRRAEQPAPTCGDPYR